MSTLTGSVYGWLSEQTGNQMEIDRRSFLTGGLVDLLLNRSHQRFWQVTILAFEEQHSVLYWIF
jgi:hypothetical protein